MHCVHSKVKYGGMIVIPIATIHRVSPSTILMTLAAEPPSAMPIPISVVRRVVGPTIKTPCVTCSMRSAIRDSDPVQWLQFEAEPS